MSDKNNNKEFKFSDFSDGSGVKMDVYSPDPRTNPHDTVHMKINRIQQQQKQMEKKKNHQDHVI